VYDIYSDEDKIKNGMILLYEALSQIIPNYNKTNISIA